MYLVQIEKTGADINKRVTRRVFRIQHIMTMVIIRGQKKGEIKNLPIKEMNGLLYILLETAMFRLGILNQQNLNEMYDIANFVIDQFRLNGEQK